MPPELLPVPIKISRTSRSRQNGSGSIGSSPSDQVAAQTTPGAGPSRKRGSLEISSTNDTSPDLSNSPFDLDPNIISSMTPSDALENWWNMDPTLLPPQSDEGPAGTLQQYPFQSPCIPNTPEAIEYLGLQYDSVPQPLTAGQASLFQALFSLSDPANDPSPAPSAGTIGYPPTSIATWFPLDIRPNVGRVEPDDESDDDESVKQIIYGTMRLDMSAEGNALPYVLESYAAWITRTAFEPKKAAPGARDLILKQFSDSEDSRWTVMTLAQIVRTLAKSTTWGDEGPISEARQGSPEKSGDIISRWLWRSLECPG
ncbi:hypothetical protein RSAG8_06262, partial [Rhizoctonia solani AG-8 WAC10335]